MPKKLISLDELSRFKDKLDIELDKKANVDGNYPTLTSGLADNLTPYSKDSGAEQENPFISNGTGTNNNTEIVTVGDYGLLKEKQGNTVVINQLVQDNELPSTQTINDVIITNNGTYITLNGTASAEIDLNISQTITTINGHYYHISGISGGSNDTYKIYFTSLSTSNIYATSVYTGNGSSSKVRLIVRNGTILSNVKIFVKLVDLTQMFNGDSDIITDLTANPDHFSWYYNGSLAYNTGTLENATGVKLVSTGRNLWDEEWEVGAISQTTGANSPSSSELRSKNYTRVVPNTDYYFHRGTYSGTCKIFLYDHEKNYIDYYTFTNGRVLTMPSNCGYLRIVIGATTYNHDITISLYYTPAQGGEGYDKYYPYEEPYVVDTGTMVKPYSAGNVRNVKKPSGLEIDYVGSYTFTGNETVSELSLNRYQLSPLSGIAKGYEGDTIAQFITTTKYTPVSRNQNANIDNSICIGGTGLIIIRDTSVANSSALLSYLAGKSIEYELATPTTEQGTPFAENLPINDYGMLYWLDSSDNLVGIPQGAKIFFPTNYKGFVDDVYMRTNGDASDLVVQSELSAVDNKHDSLYAIMQENIGGALRHQLANANSIDFDNTTWIVLGTLGWSYNSGSQIFIASLGAKRPADDNTSANILCATMKTNSRNGLQDKQISFNTSGYLVAKNSSYTDADTFKASVKGVLLAYEKA